MVADWKTNTVFFTSSLARRVPRVWERLQATLTANGIAPRRLTGAKDIWARDFMPIQIGDGEFVKFRYEPSYLRDCPSLITGPAICKQLPFLEAMQSSDIRLDGGNVVASRSLAILTDRVYSENPDWRPTELRKALREALGVEECILIPAEPEDTVGHSDGIVRFIDDRTVVLSGYGTFNPRYGDEVRKVLDRHSLDVHLLSCFLDETVKNGIQSAVGNYTNFLRVGNLVICPAYGAAEDQEALATLSRLLPSATIVPLESVQLAKEGGVLNCISWTCIQQSHFER
jgi:agmatine deiminase